MKPFILFRCKYGSHLYGTDTPTSDVDYKGVFLPTRRQAFLGKIPRSWGPGTGRAKTAGEKNQPGDVDDEFYSLQEFVKLALEGQTVAIDMLHADESMWETAHYVWNELVDNRHRFYTKNLKAFVGYARRQAAKYGIKGSRLATARAVVDWLKENPGKKISEVWSFAAPVVLFEHVDATGDEKAPVEILGKRLTAGATTDHYVPTFERYLAEYGSRAKMAETNQGVDWKAMSHAVRAAIEVEKILVERDLVLPFEPAIADHLRAIKKGELSFVEVQRELEERIERLEGLAAVSTLPSSPDHAWADDFVVRTMEIWTRDE